MFYCLLKNLPPVPRWHPRTAAPTSLPLAPTIRCRRQLDLRWSSISGSGSGATDTELAPPTEIDTQSCVAKWQRMENQWKNYGKTMEKKKGTKTENLSTTQGPCDDTKVGDGRTRKMVDPSRSQFTRHSSLPKKLGERFKGQPGLLPCAPRTCQPPLVQLPSGMCTAGHPRHAPDLEKCLENFQAKATTKVGQLSIAVLLRRAT